MCVALPGRIVWRGEVAAGSIPGRIEMAGSLQEVNLVMVPEAEVGDFVVAHSGYAIKLVPATEATDIRGLLGVSGGP